LKIYRLTDFGGQLFHQIYFNPASDALYFRTVQLLAQFVDKVPDNTKGYMDIADSTVAVYDKYHHHAELLNRHPQRTDPPALQCIRRIVIGTLKEERRFHTPPDLLFLIQAVSRMKGLRDLNIVQPTVHPIPKFPANEEQKRQIAVAQQTLSDHERMIWWYQRVVVACKTLLGPIGLGDWIPEKIFEKGWVHPRLIQTQLTTMRECQF
jgi:hypothetical protein